MVGNGRDWLGMVEISWEWWRLAENGGYYLVTVGNVGDWLGMVEIAWERWGMVEIAWERWGMVEKGGDWL